MKNGFFYLLFAAICIAALFILADWSYQGKLYTVSKKALSPDEMLMNSKFFLENKDFPKSIQKLDAAMAVMEKIQSELDESTAATLEKTLEELRGIKSDIGKGAVEIGKMNMTYKRAIRTLALAELSISDFYLDNNHSRPATLALEYCQSHLINSSKLTTRPEETIDMEMHARIDSLLYNHSVNKESVTMMIKELNGWLSM